jgi:cytidine deaminase
MMMELDSLVEAARRASRNAYVPYSRFQVGAAVLCSSGKVYTGCNIENASYGGTICAERVALTKAISEGERQFERVVVVGPNSSPTSPCGICRQFMAEFGLDVPVTMVGESGESITMTVRELLPDAFTPEALK